MGAHTGQILATRALGSASQTALGSDAHRHLWVDTGNRIVAALNSAPFQVASIYAAEPRESSFTPSGRSSPLGDTCR